MNQIQMQPPNLAFTYGIFGMKPSTVEMIIGSKAFSKIFASASGGNEVKIAPADAVPDQVINLLRVQMQTLSDRLQVVYEKAVTDANTLV